MTLDVAIIGAGVSGVYSGWRLKQAHPEWDVVVYELSDRVGGRLMSAAAPGIPSVRAELGGMRILSSQLLVSQLVEEELKLATYAFPVDSDHNIAYLRGVHLRNEEFADPGAVPYELSFNEQGKSPGVLAVDAIEQIVPGITAVGPEERRQMAREAEFDGKPLYQQGFWQVLYRVMSAEAYQLVVEAGGYQSTLTNWNAAEAIPWYLEDFGTGATYRGFKEGFEQLPIEVGKRFVAKGGNIEFGHGLRSFRRAGAGAYRLRFARGRTVEAKQVILAMPRRALELIGSPLLKRARVRRLLGSVTPRPLFKLFCCYDYPWYVAANVCLGKSNTDLPVRQCYYFGVEASNHHALVMASYDDGLNVGFWDGFRPKRGLGRSALPRDFFFEGSAPEGVEADEWRRRRAPRAMVEEVNRQLARLHDLDYVPRPYSAAFMDWGDDPFGGGWNSWNIGVKGWQVSKRIVQPEPDQPVYVCGEAYSHYQGWVEGALSTAEDMLQRKFDLAPPSWFDPDWEAPQKWADEAEELARKVNEDCSPGG